MCTGLCFLYMEDLLKEGLQSFKVMRNKLTLTLFSIMLESFVRKQEGWVVGYKLDNKNRDNDNNNKDFNPVLKILSIFILSSHTHHNNIPHKNWKSKIINVTYEKYENMFLKYVFLPGRSVKLYLYSSVHSSTQPRYN